MTHMTARFIDRNPHLFKPAKVAEARALLGVKSLNTIMRSVRAPKGKPNAK